jgi:hypothetical protein
LSKKTEEEWAAFINPVETDFDNFLVSGCLLFSYTPAKINIHQPQLPLLAPFSQFRENPFHEISRSACMSLNVLLIKILTVCHEVDMNIKNAAQRL